VAQVIDLLLNSTNDDERAMLLTRMVDSVDACNDKPAWALNQMMVLKEVVKARGNRSALRDLGRRVLNLEIVHKHAKAKCDRLKFVDDVCVYLRFEIDLRECLDLPVSALKMHYPSYIDITSDEISAAKEEALALSDSQFNAWLVSWDEWQRQDRLECAESIVYADQPVAKSVRQSWRKSIRGVLGSKPLDTVVFEGKRWSLADLLRHWVETGRDLNGNTVATDSLLGGLSRV
jgi:hypothetical protein